MEAVRVAAAAVLMQESVSTCVDCATTRAWRSRTWTDTQSHRFTWWRLVTSASSAQKASCRRWTWSNTDRTNIQLQTPPSFMYQLWRPTPKSSDAADTSADVCWVSNDQVYWAFVTEGQRVMGFCQWCSWLLIHVVCVHTLLFSTIATTCDILTLPLSLCVSREFFVQGICWWCEAFTTSSCC